MLVLTAAEVYALLDLDHLVDAIAGAMAELSSGGASLSQRAVATVASCHATLISMPAFLPSTGTLVTKVVTVFPENLDRPTHQAVICVFDPETGTPLALLDGTHITAARTAAGSALATRLLARADAQSITVIGTGVQARAHARAVVRILPDANLTLTGRDVGKAELVASELSTSLGRTVEVIASTEEAVRAADIVCATTHSDVPVVMRDWLAPGTHVNSVGHNPSGAGEVDAHIFRDALVVVESRLAALAAPPSGATEIGYGIEHGIISADDIRTEIGQVLGGEAPGRTDDTQLTLYKSVGIAIEDAAAVSLILDAARARHIGTQVTV